MTTVSDIPGRKLVVLGNGMAAGRVLEELFARAPDLFDVTVFGAEPHVNYNRIMLSPVLAGREDSSTTSSSTTTRGTRGTTSTCTRARPSSPIDRDRADRPHDDAGDVVPYDRLLIATGSPPDHHSGSRRRTRRRPHLPRSRRRAMPCWRPPHTAAARWSSAAGCSASKPPRASRRTGMDATVVHLMPTLMERQLDPNAGLPAAEGHRETRHRGS